MVTASNEAAARHQLAALPHPCGETTFDAPMTRSHDEQGLWLVFRGSCTRCNEQREVRFHARAPSAAAGLIPCSKCRGSGNVSSMPD